MGFGVQLPQGAVSLLSSEGLWFPAWWSLGTPWEREGDQA